MDQPSTQPELLTYVAYIVMSIMGTLCSLILSYFYAEDILALCKMCQSLRNITDTNTSFKDIIGRNEMKSIIMTYIDIIKNKHLYPHVQLTQGLIFAGEPGTGKTMMAKAIATEISGVRFIHLDSHGPSIAKVIRLAIRFCSPCVIFIDEIDYLNHNSDILELFDGFKTDKRTQQFLIIGCTNKHSNLSNALVRAGRLDKLIDFDNISKEDRLEVFNHYLSGYEINLLSTDIDSLYEQFKSFTPADIKTICADAFVLSLMIKGEGSGIITKQLMIKAIRQHDLSIPRLELNDNSRIIATYKAGRVLMSYLLKTPFKASTIRLSDSENRDTLRCATGILTRSETTCSIMITLGGYGAEDLILGQRSEYGETDFRFAFRLLTNMYKYGILGGGYSDDKVISDFIEGRAHPFVKATLTKHKGLLEKIIELALKCGHDLCDADIREVIPEEVMDSEEFSYE